MSLKEHPIIIFLDRNGFIIYQETLSNVWQFPFSQDLVQNLDVINKDQLLSSIEEFIKTNKVIASNLIVILSDSVIFQKELTPMHSDLDAYKASLQHGDLSKTPQSTNAPNAQVSQAQSKIINKADLIYGGKELQEKEIKSFLDNVPFEDILAKVINSTKIVAVNRDLVEAVAYPFNKVGCIIAAVVPGFIYQQYIDFSLGLSQNVARIVLQQTELLKQGNMLTDQQAVVVEREPNEPQNPGKEKPKNYRQFILIAIFIFLIIILAIVYLTLGRTPQTDVKKNVLKPSSSLKADSAPRVSIVPTVNFDANASPSPTDLKPIKITIVGSKETEALSNALKNLLSQTGFQDITLQDSPDTTPAKSSVLFSSAVSDAIREKAITEVKKIFPDVIVQENQNTDLVITIILGKS